MSFIGDLKNVIPNVDEILTLEGYIIELKNRISQNDLLNHAEISSEF